MDGGRGRGMKGGIFFFFLRRVSLSQSHLREECWKNVIFYTCISGGEERDREQGGRR